MAKKTPKTVTTFNLNDPIPVPFALGPASQVPVNTGFSSQDMASAIAAAMKEVTKSIKEGIAMAGRSNEMSYSQRPILASEIPLEDVLEEPVEFYACWWQTKIYDDKKGHNHVVNAPYGTPIEFFPHMRHPKGSAIGRNAVWQIISVARVHSKAQVEFLESHSQFGITIFKRYTDAAKFDNIYAEKLQEAAGTVANMSQRTILDTMVRNGLVISQDLVADKKRLVHRLAEKAMTSIPEHLKNMNVYPNGTAPDEVVASLQEENVLSRQHVQSIDRK